jgi:glycogen synthase
MNILMTTDCLGGMWNHALELARGLQRHHCVIHLVVFGRRLSGAQRAEIAALENVYCMESDLRLEWMDNPWDDLEAATSLLQALAKKVEPVLVHLNGYVLASKVAWRVPILIGAHSCVLSWWDAVKREPAPPWLSRYRQEVIAGLSAADVVVSPTHAILDDLRRIYEVKFPARVINNGIALTDFAISDKAPQILSAGRLWDEAKNIQLLDSVAKNIDWPVIIAGEAASPVNGHECHFAHVRVLGRLSSSALREQISRTSIYAAPALYEPFGLAVLEAGLSGCALVLANIPSFRELWEGAAVLIDPLDAAKWEAELNRLIADPRARAALAERACVRARRFTSELMSGRYHKLYRDLAARLQEAALHISA